MRRLAMKLKTAYLLVGLATGLMAHSARISNDLVRVRGRAPVQVIVRCQRQPNTADVNRMVARGANLVRHLPLIQGMVLTIPANAVADLAADGAVQYIGIDRTVRGQMEYAVPATGADIAGKYGWDGSGIGVAVIDSGIAESPDLHEGGLLGLPLRTSSRVVYRESFLPNSAGSGDLYGHGTHVAGIIAGNGWSATQTPNPRVLHGIAPSASLLDLRVLDEHGMGTDSAIIAALGRAIELKDVYNI